MGGPVLVGLDGTGNSVPAVRWGAEEAAVRNLPLHLLHSWVSPPWPASSDGEAADRRRYGSDILDRAEAMVEELHPGIPVKAEQVAEEAADALAERSGECTLLVLGSRGHDSIAGFLLGSVSLRVLGRAKCPVVTVREEESSVGPGPEIVVGVQEPGAEGDTVLAYAFATAAAHRTGLRAVHAWRSATVLGADAARPLDEVEYAAGERELLSTRLAPWREEFPGVGVIEQVARGRAVPVLLSACARAGLLVIGRRTQRTPLPLGPAVLAVLHHSRCPVAIVPRG
ncbi:universal stress protein [Streptomyces sp. CB02959]|uniref:universal stress protein n=1 Tax=Streptomyces sp. CB02959 TaxID=2020330 RepID=UPI000C274541|nr:universal stress protein [Streptomyces sp. CB02959]PJN40049.1 universal stress protein [Streptomyces sp. CB02959]